MANHRSKRMSEDKQKPPPSATPLEPKPEAGRDQGYIPANASSMPPPRSETEYQPTFMDGCLKVLGVLIIGAFVLGGLVFATCFLSMRR
jgi:hypothetical protein